jgi:hypothetical protein
MRAETSFHRDDARWELLERRLEGKALDLPSQNQSAIRAESDEVENLLADVDLNTAGSNRILSDLGRHGASPSGQ